MRLFITSPRPAHYECAALPTELHQHIKLWKIVKSMFWSELIRICFLCVRPARFGANPHGIVPWSLYQYSTTCALRMRCSNRLIEFALYARLVRAFGEFAAASCSCYTSILNCEPRASARKAVFNRSAYAILSARCRFLLNCESVFAKSIFLSLSASLYRRSIPCSLKGTWHLLHKEPKMPHNKIPTQHIVFRRRKNSK